MMRHANDTSIKQCIASVHVRSRPKCGETKTRMRGLKILTLCACLVAMVTFCSSCHVLPEKVVTRSRLCSGPILVMQDIGPCGTTMPKYLEDLSFKVYFGWAELVSEF